MGGHLRTKVKELVVAVLEMRMGVLVMTSDFFKE